MSGALSDLQKKPAPLFFHNKNGFLPRIDIHHSTLGNCCLFPGQQMDSRLMNGQPRKAGVDYGKCQAEFEAQMLLLEKDLKKWLHRTQNENEGRKIPDSLRHSSLEDGLQIRTRDQKQNKNLQHDVRSVAVSCCGVSRRP
ncbi:hypothetical protein FOZG_17334 [Fusarium oxysporum Fo47]|uniref:Uncharacterized protein n=1 Tax=Fusarium oxysporum Fo47 TaxID=660027 RepID=W9JH97_FUSOX|nr:hypothetical protein FOZG_17334 [Fusarium oxysporum Fo47]